MQKKIVPTLDVDASGGLLLSTHTAVVSTVFWSHGADQQFVH